MKLILENWQKYLGEDGQPQEEKVIAYHSSNTKLERFSIGYADKGSHSGDGLYFASIPEGTLRNKKNLYKVELTLIKGIRQLDSEPTPTRKDLIKKGYNYAYDFAYPILEEDENRDEDDWDEDDWGDPDDVEEYTVYRMLRDEDIKLLERTKLKN